MERWVLGRAVENGSPFYPSGFAIVLFFFFFFKWFLISGASFIFAFSCKKKKKVEFELNLIDRRVKQQFGFNPCGF